MTDCSLHTVTEIRYDSFGSPSVAHCSKYGTETVVIKHIT